MGSPDTPSAPKVNYQKDINQYVGALGNALPKIFNLENQYRDDFTKLNMRDVRQTLGGQGGLFDLSRRAANQSTDLIGDMRRQELLRMRNQTGATRNLLKNLSPEAASMVQQSVDDANIAQRSALGLTGSEQRTAQQFAREAAADRGRVLDNSSMASEILNRDDILARKRAEASQATNNAFNLATQMYTQPGLQALYSTPQGYSAGQNMLGLGLGAIGSARPQMVDPGMGFNLGAVNRNNQLQANMAGTQAQSNYNAGLMGGFGSLIGGIF